MTIGAKSKSNGILLLLKSFGIDPEELERQAREFMGGVQQQQQLILDSLERIEKKLEEIQNGRRDSNSGSSC
jgi:hypothetical protein